MRAKRVSDERERVGGERVEGSSEEACGSVGGRADCEPVIPAYEA